MILDPALLSGVIAGVNKAIAGALKYDPGTQASLHALDGKVLQIHCTSPNLSLYGIIESGGVRLSQHYEGAVHCSLTGRASALLGLLWQDGHSLADSGVTVNGEPGLLGKVQQLLKQLDLDWQEPITDLLGDTAAYPVLRFIGRQGEFLHRGVQRLPDWLGDTLTEELQLLPSNDELNLFYQDVSDLRADCDRLEARIEKLRGTRKTKQPE